VQRVWFASSLGIFDIIFFLYGCNFLVNMHAGLYRADRRTVTRNYYGIWWLALLSSMLAIPFIVVSSLMPLGIQTYMQDVVPSFVPWVVIITKVVQFCIPSVLWAFASKCRVERSNQ
jgi:hypothetical protein